MVKYYEDVKLAHELYPWESMSALLHMEGIVADKL